MKGLVIKDFMMMKRSILLYILIFAIYSVLGVATGNAGMMVVFSVMMAGILPGNSIAYDERYHWDSFAPVLPLGRKQVVLSKYVFGMLLTAMTFAINIPVFILRSIKQPDMFEGMADIILFDLIIVCVCIIIQAISLPVNIKFGTKKSRLVMMLICAVPVAIFVSASMVSANIGLSLFTKQPSEFMLTLVFIIVSAVLYTISIKLSTKWYEAKEF